MTLSYKFHHSGQCLVYLYLKLNVRGDRSMKDVVLNEVKKELNFGERFIVKLFTKTIKKIYTKGVKKGYNWNNYGVR